MKIILLNANDSSKGNLKNFLNKSYPPLGLLYLIGHARKYISEELDFIIPNKKEDIKSPDLIGITSVTESFTYAVKKASELKKSFPDVPVILGGPHISALPHTLPEEFDIAVIGEGEMTFTELLKLYLKKGSFPQEELKKIPGIVYHDKKRNLYRTAPGKFIKDLDTIPVPDRNLFPESSMAHMVTSRGCKFNCSFCSSPYIWKKYRAHSPLYVVEELKIIYAQKKNRYILFFDDLFIVNKKRIIEISDILNAEGLNGEFEFFAYGRTELINKSMLMALKKINIVEVSLGTQYTSEGFSGKVSQRAVDLCNEYGIRVGCSFMIGIPLETEEYLWDLYNFIGKNIHKLSSIQVSPVRPFPGTPLWDYARKEGMVDDYMEDWSVMENFSLFSEFNVDNYMYLNRNIEFNKFKDYCRELKSLLSADKSIF